MRIPFIKQVNIKNVEVQQQDVYKEERIGSITFPDKLTDDNAFTLSNTVSEIYFPIDFIADRASKVRYMITRDGNEVKGDISRFVQDINPLFNFSDLVYMAVFSYLSDGNMVALRAAPRSYAKSTKDTISRIDIILPDNLELTEKSNVNPLLIGSWTDAIQRAKYILNGKSSPIEIENLFIRQIDATRRDDSLILSRSPLYKAIRPINNLLATYSARYNVYVNNGYAGILTRKTTGGNGLAEAVNPADKSKILADLNTHGITGNRNLLGINGITGVPVDFINTMSTIKDLLPFEETLEDSVKIAGVFQLPSVLVPRKDQSTFDNQGEAERAAWENAIMSVIGTFCDFWTKVCGLDKERVEADYSTVSCLQENKEQREDVITKRLDNLKKLQDLGVDVTNETTKIIEEYGK